MLLFIPVRTDSPVRRPPYVNYALIALNVLAFLATDVLAPTRFLASTAGPSLKVMLGLNADSPTLFQFITYQFIHNDIMHLGGNMLFLWVFGNSVNSKMGSIPYTLFYLACGVFAGTGFAAQNAGRLIGASGSIAGVTTAYLVLYPRSEITIFYWLWFYIGTMHVQALFVIGGKIILWDNMLAPSFFKNTGGESSVAYSAHLAGYFFGFVVSLIMLLIRGLPRDQYDVLAVWKRAYQRHQMKAIMSDPASQAKAQYGRVARVMPPYAGGLESLPEAIPVNLLDDVARARLEITQLLDKGDYTGAAERYEQLVAQYPDQCLPRTQMLDVANQLVALQHHEQAASAYEKYLQNYPKASDSQQIKLMLGILYARYLRQFQSAKPYLEESVARLTNEHQRAQAGHWLDVVREALRSTGPAAPGAPAV